MYMLIIISILEFIAQVIAPAIYHPAYTPQQLIDYVALQRYTNQMADWLDRQDARELALADDIRRNWRERRN
jgi:hypothetical protein